MDRACKALQLTADYEDTELKKKDEAEDASRCIKYTKREESAERP